MASHTPTSERSDAAQRSGRRRASIAPRAQRRGGTPQCRRAAGLVARSKRAVGQRSKPRRRARWSAYDSPMMLLTDPQVRRLTLSAGCSEWERRLKPQLRTLVRVRVRVSSQPRRSRHSSPPPSSPPPLPPSRLHLASICISPPSLASICHLASTSSASAVSPPSASRLQLASVSLPSRQSPPYRLHLACRSRFCASAVSRRSCCSSSTTAH